MLRNIAERLVMLEAIIRKTGMSTRPEFYSGRGATISDLDSGKLDSIYQGIAVKFGEEAGKNFIQMIADMSSLSATAFLKTLYRLQSNDWQWAKFLTEDGVAISDEASSWGTLGEVISRDYHQDDTFRIKREFLLNHGVPTPHRVILGLHGTPHNNWG